MRTKSSIILVLNSGSSSLKFQLFQMGREEQMLAKGMIERIGLKDPIAGIKCSDGREYKDRPALQNHDAALRLVCEKLVAADSGVAVLQSLGDVHAVGHRVVHGAEEFRDSAVVTPEVKAAIAKCIPLAPLHNPANLMGIDACEKAFAGIPNVAVFDTAFHSSMPPSSYLYAVPYDYYQKYGIRKYGFHGTSHKYVAESAAKYLRHNLADLRLITCHLGNGCSITAIDRGKVVDTSMGMTPLPGLVMGTRCGDIDPAVIIYLMRQGMSPDDIDNLLNKKSGLLGVAGISSDMREIIDATEAGHELATRAMNLFIQRLVFYIGSYHTILHGAHAVVFTGGIGENSPYIRARIVERIHRLGCHIDKAKNDAIVGRPAIVSDERSTLKAMVMPTNEELMIARDTMRVLGD